MFTKLPTNKIKAVMEDIANNLDEIINSKLYINSSLAPINKVSHHLFIRLSEEINDEVYYIAPVSQDQTALYKNLFAIIWQKIFLNSSDGLDKIAAQNLVKQFLRETEKKISQC